MSKRLYISFIFLPLALGSYSQTMDDNILDSLYSEWKANSDDSIRTSAIIQLMDFFRDNQQMDSAYTLALKARNFAREKAYKNSLAYIYKNLGALSHIKSNYDSALHYDLLALRLYTELNDSSNIAIALNSIGEDYLDREFYGMAYDYYYRSYNTARRIGDSLTMAITTYNMGRVLKEQGHFERAFININKALEISSRIGDEEGIAYAYYDMGGIFIKLGKHDEALEKLEKALEISQSLSIYILIPQIYNKIGELHEIRDHYDLAIENYEEALNYNMRLNNRSGIGQSYRGLGSVYSETGDYAKAEEYFKECLKIAQGVNSADLQGHCYLELSELFEKKGQIEKAFAYYKQYKVAQDSLISAKKGEQLAQMQMEHITEQNDLEIELLNQREMQQLKQIQQEEFIRNVLVVIVAFFIVLLITLYRSSARRKRMNNLLVIQQQELEQQRSELVELNKVKDKFFSIISHDLRSPINNLAGMSALLTSGNITHEETKLLSKSIQKQLRHASKLLDNLMDWVLLQSNEIKIRKENINLKELVDENIEIFNDLNEKDLQLINEVEDIKVLADRNMLDLIIRNLIGNAIKFTEKGGRIVVSSSEENNKVVVSVADNGIGIPEDIKKDLFEFKSHYTRKGTANEKGTGLGLKLCKEFVERNGGQIWVESEEGKGSNFKFTLDKAL